MIINVPSEYPTIQAAIYAANVGDEVVIAPGTYYEQNLKFHGKAIVVRGSNPQDNSVVDATIVHGNGTLPVFNLYSNETPDSVIRGLTITSDEAAEPRIFGGGIDLYEASPTIEYCHITGNRAMYGGGICTYLSMAHIHHNRIKNNHATLVGGGIHASESSVTIEHNHIADNIGELYGGGAHILDTIQSSSVLYNYIHHNTSDLGGGLYIAGQQQSRVENNVICHNLEGEPGECELPMGGGVYLYNHSGTFINNTVSHNSSEMGGNVLVKGAIVPDMRNCIITFSTRGSGVCSYQGDLKLRYCNVYGNAEDNYQMVDGTISMEGPMSEDPLFHDPDNDDFHLQSISGRWDPVTRSWVSDVASSPCIDAGDAASDFSNEPMGNGARINMGAYGNTAEASKSPATLIIWIIRLILYYLIRIFRAVIPG